MNTLLSQKTAATKRLFSFSGSFELPTFGFSMAYGFIYHIISKEQFFVVVEMRIKLMQKLPSSI